MKGDVYSIDALADPVTSAEFLDQYWEQKHLLISRDDPHFYGSLFSIADMDRCLNAATDTIRDVLSIVPPPGSDRKQTTLRGLDISLKALYQAFNAGDTISVRSAQRLSPKLTDLCATLSEALSATVGINLYMTPANSQGFEIHFDTHEVMILQVDGSKNWFVYDRYHDSPMEVGDARSYVRHQAQPKPREEETLLEEIHLKQGDFLYLPRGFPHKAKTSGEPSLHLTVGIYPLYWVDLVKAAFETVAFDQHAELRRGLPPGFTHDADVQAGMAETFKSIFDRTSPKAANAFDQALQEIIQYQMNTQAMPPDGHFAQLTALERVNLESVVRRRSGLDCRVVNSNNSMGIVFSGNEIRGPMSIKPALEFVRDRRRFQVKELPHPDANSRIVLTRRLIREGLLRVESPSASA